MRACAPHLYLQLLNHLHLDSALSGAAVIEGVLVVQVPECEREHRRNQVGLQGAAIYLGVFVLVNVSRERQSDPLTAGCGPEVKEQS